MLWTAVKALQEAYPDHLLVFYVWEGLDTDQLFDQVKVHQLLCARLNSGSRLTNRIQFLLSFDTGHGLNLQGLL